VLGARSGGVLGALLELTVSSLLLIGNSKAQGHIGPHGLAEPCKAVIMGHVIQPGSSCSLSVLCVKCSLMVLLGRLSHRLMADRLFWHLVGGIALTSTLGPDDDDDGCDDLIGNFKMHSVLWPWCF